MMNIFSPFSADKSVLLSYVCIHVLLQFICMWDCYFPEVPDRTPSSCVALFPAHLIYPQWLTIPPSLSLISSSRSFHHLSTHPFPGPSTTTCPHPPFIAPLEWQQTAQRPYCAVRWKRARQSAHGSGYPAVTISRGHSVSHCPALLRGLELFTHRSNSELPLHWTPWVPPHRADATPGPPVPAWHTATPLTETQTSTAALSSKTMMALSYYAILYGFKARRK